MDGRIDMILDDGESVIGLESTIIDMTEEPPVLLRPGAVTVEMIRECIPDLSTGQESRLEKEAHPRAPGMKYRHYAPQAPLILVDSDQAIRDLCVQAAGEGKKVGVLTSREHASFYEASCVRILGGEADEEEMAHNLFAKDTIEGFKAIIDGDMDKYPEAAFLMAGTIDDVIMKARQMDE